MRNDWKDIFREILKPDLTLIFGEKIREEEIHLKIKTDLGMFKEKKEITILERYLDRKKYLLYLLFRDFSKRPPVLKKKEIKVTRRKSVFQLTMETEIFHKKSTAIFLSLFMNEVFNKKKKKGGKIIVKSNNLFIIEDLNFFSGRKYIDKIIEPEELREFKIEIELKNEKKFDSFFLRFAGLRNE